MLSTTPLATDLYQLTMMAGYFAGGRHESVTATFELFVRRLPRNRRYLVAAGLGPLLDYLEGLRFSADEVAWLRSLPQLASAPDAFFAYLRAFRFSGDVWAMPEGTPLFPNEPLLQVTAPLPEAQLIETAALAFVNFQTSVASKGARVVAAAQGRDVMEFGARRAHGVEAALYAARSAYLAGCTGTSYVEAGKRFGIPLSGTMAHSWVLSAATELEAFEEYAALFGEQSILLLDTYDTVAAARQVVLSGLRPTAVRLDSGDLLSLSREVRRILDQGGLTSTRLLASGDLDEHIIRDLLAGGAPIDGFGVGTELVTSADAPALGGVYKLVELAEGGEVRRVMKRSTGKGTWPGRKQVWRVMSAGAAARDVVSFGEEPPVADAMPLIHPAMKNGIRLVGQPTLDESRRWCRDRVRELPADVLAIAKDEGTRREGTLVYRVDPSAALSGAISETRTP